eukprot:TRINITY_DN19382_c0_g1_i1.p1 TRINITY_DN19382_c0_g1~~TRINITY_DN19382_c0_g1_i1.p1  ORF type:complete len:172 (+),score=74.18 TRINITY_DN19382_c0_g1_i1:378-893(+)
MVVGRVKDGEGNKTDYINRYIAGVIKIGAWIKDEMKQEMIPVEWIAEKSVEIVEESKTNELWDGRVYHLVQKNRITWRQLGRWIGNWSEEKKRKRMRGEEYGIWRRRLEEEIEEGNELYGLRPFFGEEWSAGRSERVAQSENLEELLGEKRAECMEMTEEAVWKYCDFNSK